jgi:hypothetical protein
VDALVTPTSAVPNVQVARPWFESKQREFSKLGRTESAIQKTREWELHEEVETANPLGQLPRLFLAKQPPSAAQQIEKALSGTTALA